MKTTSLVKGVGEDNICAKTIDEHKGVVVGARRLLQPLQEAAGDKENLVGGGRLCVEPMPPSREKHSSTSKTRDGTPKKSKVGKVHEKKTISVEDLTSEESPGVVYWEALCEKQAAALHQALEENKVLHSRLASLEAENAQCKVLIQETKALVDTLTEMLNEKDDGEE